MAQVWTDYGLGEVIASETVRGRTQHKVAVNGNEIWIDETKLAWAPVDHDNSVNLPYDPSPQYPAIPGDTESTLQPIHEIDADERLSPADSITFEDRGDDESIIDGHSDNFAKSAAGMVPYDKYPSHAGAEADYADAYPPGHEFHEFYADEPDPMEQAFASEAPMEEFGHGPVSADHWRGQDAELNRFGSTEHEGFAFLIPLAEGLAGAGGAAAGGSAAGAAASGGMGSALAGGIGRGVGMGVASDVLGGGGDDQGGDTGGGAAGMAQQAIDATSPGEGWGELQRGAALDTWLDSRQASAADIGAGLSERYIDITAQVDPNDPVMQFRNDPVAYINRTGHIIDEAPSATMEHYGQLVEADASIREAAWKDVRAKAMRLRREGRVHVKDVDTDRIYASVDGDHGTYDVMIAKGGAFGGFGGGHSITNWRCACEWGKWAFQRRLTYVGRLCSHGYAAYMEHIVRPVSFATCPKVCSRAALEAKVVTSTRPLASPTTRSRSARTLPSEPEGLSLNTLVESQTSARIP